MTPADISQEEIPEALRGPLPDASASGSIDAVNELLTSVDAMKAVETKPLKADPGFRFRSGKTYTHSIGLSCCFRQWRASDSHCRFLHGYALQVELEFGTTHLDSRNWVVDFGGLKEVKAVLEGYFDHKTIVAHDDPMFEQLLELNNNVIDIVTMDHVGCEAFAKFIYQEVVRELKEINPDVLLVKVTVREHESNWASYGVDR